MSINGKKEDSSIDGLTIFRKGSMIQVIEQSIAQLRTRNTKPIFPSCR